MGGKKKAGGKGKAKKGDAGDGDLDPREAAQLLAIQVNSLKQKLVLQQQRADKSKASQNQLRNRVMGLDKMMDDEKSQTWKITCEMTRQFKSMQQELISKINKLTDQNTMLKQTVQRKDETIKKLEAEKEQQLATKDAQISTLKKNIQEMSSKFTDMLKETLQKMQQRIELANNQWENQNDSTNLKRIQEIAQVNK